MPPLLSPPIDQGWQRREERVVVAAAAGVPCVIFGVAVSQREGGIVVGGIGDEKVGRWWRWACCSVVRGATSAGGGAAEQQRACCDIVGVTLLR